MPLRKKTVKAPKATGDKENALSRIMRKNTSNQTYKSPPRSMSQVDLRPLPTLRPSSPLFESPSRIPTFTPLADTHTSPGSSGKKRQHRRSRSFSALSPSSTSRSLASLSSQNTLKAIQGNRQRSSHGPAPGIDSTDYDPFARLDSGRDPLTGDDPLTINQPWRSQETWKALHSPSQATFQTPFQRSAAEARPYGDCGWRGKGGFFAGGMVSERAIPIPSSSSSSSLTTPKRIPGKFTGPGTECLGASPVKRTGGSIPHRKSSGSIRSNRSSRASLRLRSSPSIPSRNSSLRIHRRDSIRTPQQQQLGSTTTSCSIASISITRDDESGEHRTSSCIATEECPAAASTPPLSGRRVSEHTITSSEDHSQICTPISERPEHGFGLPPALTIIKSATTTDIPDSFAQTGSQPEERPLDPDHAPSDGGEGEVVGGEDCLLPPLTPRSILKQPSRSASFASLPCLPQQGDQPSPLAPPPIPWGRRGSSPRAPSSRSGSTTPHSITGANTPPPPIPMDLPCLPGSHTAHADPPHEGLQTPPPRSRSGSISTMKSSTTRSTARTPAPSRALPRPPPCDVPDSPEEHYDPFRHIPNVSTAGTSTSTVPSSSKLRAAMANNGSGSVSMPKSKSAPAVDRLCSDIGVQSRSTNASRSTSKPLLPQRDRSASQELHSKGTHASHDSNSSTGSNGSSDRSDEIKTPSISEHSQSGHSQVGSGPSVSRSTSGSGSVSPHKRTGGIYTRESLVDVQRQMTVTPTSAPTCVTVGGMKTSASVNSIRSVERGGWL